MSNFKLLLNKTYLFLSQYPEEEYSQASLAEKLGCNRKTISKELKEICNTEPIQLNNYYENIEDKYMRAAYILEDLGYKDLTIKELAEMLGISDGTVKNHIKRTKTLR